jgi:hypothetical protein
LVLVGCVASAAKPSALDVAKDFRAGLESGTWRALLAKFPDHPALPGRIRRIEKGADAVATGKWDISVVEAKQNGNAALAIIHESPKQGHVSLDFDPMYLVLQDGVWKLLPDMDEYHKPYYPFDQETLQRFKDLEAWFEIRKKELQDRIREGKK